jgi:hypothetical protein
MDPKLHNYKKGEEIPNFHIKTLKSLPACTDFITRYKSALREIIWWSRELSTEENHYIQEMAPEKGLIHPCNYGLELLTASSSSHTSNLNGAYQPSSTCMRKTSNSSANNLSLPSGKKLDCTAQNTHPRSCKNVLKEIRLNNAATLRSLNGRNQPDPSLPQKMPPMSPSNSMNVSQPSLHNHNMASSDPLTVPMATDCPGTNYSKITTQNVQCLRSEEKLEYLPASFRKKLHHGNKWWLPIYLSWTRNSTHQRHKRWSYNHTLRRVE